MRSRYSAFVKGELEYLLVTHPEAHVPEAERRQQLRRSSRATRWMGLRILSCTDGGVGDMAGTVVFEARHREGVFCGKRRSFNDAVEAPMAIGSTSKPSTLTKASVDVNGTAPGMLPTPL
jgi:uncharacterized protein YchJ